VVATLHEVDRRPVRWVVVDQPFLSMRRTTSPYETVVTPALVRSVITTVCPAGHRSDPDSESSARAGPDENVTSVTMPVAMAIPVRFMPVPFVALSRTSADPSLGAVLDDAAAWYETHS
jgi:hypothetical protein